MTSSFPLFSTPAATHSIQGSGHPWGSGRAASYFLLALGVRFVI